MFVLSLRSNFNKSMKRLLKMIDGRSSISSIDTLLSDRRLIQIDKAGALNPIGYLTKPFETDDDGKFNFYLPVCGEVRFFSVSIYISNLYSCVSTTVLSLSCFIMKGEGPKIIPLITQKRNTHVDTDLTPCSMISF